MANVPCGGAEQKVVISTMIIIFCYNCTQFIFENAWINFVCRFVKFVAESFFGTRAMLSGFEVLTSGSYFSYVCFACMCLSLL